MSLPRTILAQSPAFAGPATRPYRIVLRRLRDGSFSVHRQYLDAQGFEEGDYFGTEYLAAMRRWLDRTAHEIERRDVPCWDFTPVCGCKVE